MNRINRGAVLLVALGMSAVAAKANAAEPFTGAYAGGTIGVFASLVGKERDLEDDETFSLGKR